MRIVRLISMGLLLCSVGCISWTGGKREGGSIRHIVGYARVNRPPAWSSGEPPQISQVAEVGVSLGREGFLLGYGDRTVVTLPPGERG